MEALPGTRGVRRRWECSAWGSWPWDSPRAGDPSLGLPALPGQGVMEVPWIRGVPDLQDVGSGCPGSPGHPDILPGSSGAAQDLVNPLRLPTPLEQGVAEVPLGSGCPGAQGHLPRSSLSWLPSLIPGAGSGVEQGWLAAGAWGEAPSPSLGAGGGDTEGTGCPRSAQPQTRAPCQHPLPRDRLPGRARLPLLPLVPVPLP